MKLIKNVIVSLSFLIIGAMLLKFYLTGDSYVSLTNFLNNLPPLYIAEVFDETFTGFQNAILEIGEAFNDGFEFSDIIDAFIEFFKLHVLLLKFLVVDATKLLIDVVLWVKKVLELLLIPTDPILTPFDKEILV